MTTNLRDTAARRWELVAGSSAKFWEVAQDGTTVTVRFGRIGTAGQTQTKDLGDTDAATAHVAKLVAEKEKKGYTAVTSTTPTPLAAATGPIPATAAPASSANASLAPTSPAPTNPASTTPAPTTRDGATPAPTSPPPARSSQAPTPAHPHHLSTPPHPASHTPAHRPRRPPTKTPGRCPPPGTAT
ncbi:WGR domain-containing protein [Lentzea guizhouensis]|uniref:WGR domain-containing protein n=1 Tax=Lentzea guizhouensis TaxID=1586287 RepID=UPI001C54E2BE|nr:WGR domain-containing protein [Lentzea guizhouensis]